MEKSFVAVAGGTGGLRTLGILGVQGLWREQRVGGLEVHWRFGDVRDLGTQETHTGSQMGATGHPSPFPNTRSQVLTQGTLYDHGHHSMRQRTDDTHGFAVCHEGWHHTRALGTLHPLHWRCPVLSESPHASPHPSGHGTVPLFTRAWAQE